MSVTLFRCGALFTPEPETQRLCILTRDGKVVDLLTDAQAAHVTGAEVVDLSGLTVGPGLVDLHCHGALGSDFADGTTGDVRTAALHHLRTGTTTLLAGVGSCSLDEMRRVCETVPAVASEVPNLAGVHLEGPYFNAGFYGCHLKEMIRHPIRTEWEQLESLQPAIRLVTIAPELPGALEFIREFSSRGTVFSIGHSAATYEEITLACEAGLTHSTHVFNAMPRAERRDMVLQPGVLETVLMLDCLSTEVIGDGIHVGARLVEFVHKVKGKGRTALVSDALRGVGCPPGDYAFGPRSGKLCRLLDTPRVGVVPDQPQTLASSAIVLSDAIRILVGCTRISLADLWTMASLTPARILHMDGRKGSLAPGKDADLLALRPDFSVAEVYHAGKKVAAARP